MKYDIHHSIVDGDRVPRKIKKQFLGLRLNKAKLKRLLNSVEIISRAKTMYERPQIKPYEFCPHCGCQNMFGSGNKTSYPEHWEDFKCYRCKKTVGYIDNSPFIHALECADNDYDPTF